MVVCKEESYLETKKKFKNLISSPSEFKFCEQPISSLTSIEIACEPLPKNFSRTVSQYYFFLGLILCSFLHQLMCNLMNSESQLWYKHSENLILTVLCWANHSFSIVSISVNKNFLQKGFLLFKDLYFKVSITQHS